MRRDEAMARWYRSKVSPSRVSGQSRRWVMYTRTENSPISRFPSMAIRPPTTRVIVNPARIAIRMSGMNAAEYRMAATLASLYAWLASATRSTSRASAVKALMVAMPPRLLVNVAAMSPAAARTAS